MQLPVAVQVAPGGRVPAVRLDVVGVFRDAPDRAGLARRTLLVEAALQAVILMPAVKRFEQRVLGEVGAMLVIMKPRAPGICVARFEQAMHHLLNSVSERVIKALRKVRPPAWQIGQLVLKAADDGRADVLWQPTRKLPMHRVQQLLTRGGLEVVVALPD